MNLSKAMFVTSCGALLFAYGVAVGAYELFPYRWLNYLHDSAVAVTSEREMLLGVRPTEFLQPSRYEGDGVATWDAERAQDGLTLLSGFFDDGNELRLLDMDGTVVHRWPVRYSQIWPDPAHVRPVSKVPTTDWNTDIHGALLFSDGSVAFNFEGLGLTKVDWCGEIEWQVPRMTHHSLGRAADGGFWVPGYRYVDSVTVNPYPPLKRPYLNHTLLRVSESGAVLDEIAVLDFFFENDLEALLFANGAQRLTIPDPDVLHLNDIEELPSAWAGAFPDFRAGDLLLSMRDLNLLMVVDPATRAVRWHRTGPWIRQHDPDFREDGTITVFNNNTDRAGGTVFGGSNIIMIDPTTDEWRVTYGARSGQGFYTNARGKHQNLANGNTLITEHEAGRVFEVTESGEIVWEYVNRYGPDEVAEVTEAIRYARDYVSVPSRACESREEGEAR